MSVEIGAESMVQPADRVSAVPGDLVSACFSAAMLVPDAIGMLGNAEPGR